MIVTAAGSALGFFAISRLGGHWPLWAAMGLVVLVGVFLMAGNGANFCIAPLIRKPLTGQIAGLIGAYGSVGSVAFMTIWLLSNPLTFFASMACTALAGFLCCFFLREPSRSEVGVSVRGSTKEFEAPGVI